MKRKKNGSSLCNSFWTPNQAYICLLLVLPLTPMYFVLLLLVLSLLTSTNVYSHIIYIQILPFAHIMYIDVVLFRPRCLHADLVIYRKMQMKQRNNILSCLLKMKTKYTKACSCAQHSKKNQRYEVMLAHLMRRMKRSSKKCIYVYNMHEYYCKLVCNSNRVFSRFACL